MSNGPPTRAVPEMPKQYLPADNEPVVRAKWDAARAFHADPARVLSGQAEPYAVLIPPPNVTAPLHLGHGLNNTLQDVLVRAHRMKGFETLWMPGTDHAGIATQTVVEKRVLAEEGKRRTEFARDEFIAKIQAFKDEYEARIIEQLKRLGCSCDWERQRFTMDSVCARAVREAFFQLFKAGLIYRGKRLVNWDPVTQTALADDEVEMEEIDGFFYYLRYPLVHRAPEPGADAMPVTWNELAARGYPAADAQEGDEQAWVTVATTRPETYLGDTAVAINPKDPRATALRGLFVELPLVGRIIPIIEDDYVVMPASLGGDPADPKAQFATGFLKVTPAHDPNDYEIGRRHDLPLINVMAPDATISDRHGWTDVGDARRFVGQSREEARKMVVKEFGARGWLEKKTPYRHAVGHSYRSHAPIEPYLSDQWYVKVTDDSLKGAALSAMAIDQRCAERLQEPLSTARHAKGPDSVAVDGLRFFPARYAKTFETWHQNIRDWCISRQLWWGHRIPVWWAPEGAPLPAQHPFTNDRVVTRVDGGRICACIQSSDDSEAVDYFQKQGWTQDPDVLDTWFSSALWPLSTMGWPDADAAAAETGIADFPQLLPAFNPSNVLVTGRDIITLWVSRMVMFNRWFTDPSEDPAARRGDGHLPFRHVYINPIIQDGHGQRMSKSLGNGVDPLDIVESHGADALRFVLCQVATSTQDVRMPVDLICPHTGKTFQPRFITSPAGYQVAAPIQESPGDPSKKMVTGYGVASGQARPTPDMPLARNTSSKFDLGRNFATKLWNAARFTLSMLAEPPAPHADPRGELPLADRWMLSRLAAAIESVDKALGGYEFSVYAQSMYDLLWRDFCDWYLESIKPTAASNPVQRAVLRATLDAILRLLHPIMPFVTEAVYEQLSAAPASTIRGLTLHPSPNQLLCRAGWPLADASLHNPEAEAAYARIQSLVTAVREVRAQHQVPPRRLVTLHLSADLQLDLAAAGGLDLVKTLAGVGAIESSAAPDRSAEFLFEGARLAVSNLADAVSADAERARLEKHAADLRKSIAALEGRLANPGYAERAPAHLVEQSRAELARKQGELDQTLATLSRLS